jgi:hypothetical protein
VSTVPTAWTHDDAWCSGCHCLVELCECPSELEEQLEASLTGDVASRFGLPSEAQLIAVDAQLSRLLREGPPRRQGITPKATAQKE